MGKATPGKTVVCIDNHGKRHEVSTSVLAWRPSAYAIVIKDGKLLVSPQFNGYDLPGGGVDLGELPEAGAVRETKEETGLDVENPRLVTAMSTFFKPSMPDPGEPEAMQSLMFYYACDFVGGEISTDGFDEYEKQYARMAEWLPLEKLDDIHVASSVDWRPFVRQALDANPRH